MDVIKIPCPTDGCDGTVTVAAEPVSGGQLWAIEQSDGAPNLSCTERCRSPQELEAPVLAVLQAG